MFKIDGKNPFVCDENEFSGVKKIAGKVCLDVERVTGRKPVVSTVVEPVETTVYFATLGQAPLAEKLASDNGLSTELSKITGKRECYLFAVNPGRRQRRQGAKAGTCDPTDLSAGSLRAAPCGKAGL